jgi:ATP-dependent RNA helicase DeaD
MLPQNTEKSSLESSLSPSLDSFDSFNLPDTLQAALKEMGITTPTPVQTATIALAVDGKDVMASAQTGTGKTLAYTLPLMVRLLASPQSNALVLAPTRELAAQVKDILRLLLGKNPTFGMALLIGGESMGRQFDQLKRRPRIIVGTPGRICDHLNRGSLSLKFTSFLAIDEADRMLDMGFSVQLDKIATYLPATRQTLMFSATMPKDIIDLSKKYLQDPVRVCVDSPTKAAPNIKQEIIRTTSGEKFSNLLRELGLREGSKIIFVKTKRGADQLADKLRQEEMIADSIHGDLNQRQRDRAIAQFRNNLTNILVATDVAARGLDIPHIRHVINYDLPQCAEDFIHRIGRTARAGSEGNALSLICPDDNSKWNAINRLMNPGSASSSGDFGGGNQRRGYGGRGSFGRTDQGRTSQGRTSQSRDFQNPSFRGRSEFSTNKPQWGQPSSSSDDQSSRRYSRPNGGRSSDYGNEGSYNSQQPNSQQPWNASRRPSGQPPRRAAEPAVGNGQYSRSSWGNAGGQGKDYSSYQNSNGQASPSSRQPWDSPARQKPLSLNTTKSDAPKGRSPARRTTRDF